ncbi:MAG: glycosyltransferase [Anaerolineae bacterium]|nr:glycosyltransferase [Gloeobacterales cyanobacterium ES-bin-313]
MNVSVIIPTFKPNQERLRKTLDALRIQTLPKVEWELIVVDNNTPDQKWVSSFDYAWQPNTEIVREARQGLTWARLAGIAASQGEYLVLVDDDNVLCPSYLESVAKILDSRPKLGAIGGKSVPEFESKPQPWIKEFQSYLALRDLGDEVQIAGWKQPPQYPLCAPIGAGMALRRTAACAYADLISKRKERVLDRTGKKLTSGGDNDIVLSSLQLGWEVGYFPELQLTHLIPASRFEKEYLARLAHGISCSWPQVLILHGIQPWQSIPAWSVVPRKMRAYFRYRAWQSEAAYVRWMGACGHFEGIAKLAN